MTSREGLGVGFGIVVALAVGVWLQAWSQVGKPVVITQEPPKLDIKTVYYESRPRVTDTVWFERAERMANYIQKRVRGPHGVVCQKTIAGITITGDEITPMFGWYTPFGLVITRWESETIRETRE